MVTTSTILNTRAAAIRVGLARQTLAKLRSEGGGPAFRKLGSRVFYTVEALDEWVASHPLRTSTAKAA